MVKKGESRISMGLNDFFLFKTGSLNDLKACIHIIEGKKMRE
jgi:hypothetical protein